jgi:hypothetical protein
MRRRGKRRETQAWERRTKSGSSRAVVDASEPLFLFEGSDGDRVHQIGRRLLTFPLPFPAIFR